MLALGGLLADHEQGGVGARAEGAGGFLGGGAVDENQVVAFAEFVEQVEHFRRLQKAGGLLMGDFGAFQTRMR